jgi:putative flippase GtrA
MTSGNPAFASSLVARPGVRQLVKFCIVGASSTIIDLVIFNIVISLSIPPVFAVIAGFIGGVSNGFYWNRRWTFKEKAGNMAKQGPIFFATNLVGLTLNILVTTLALIVAAHLHLTQTHFTPEQTMRMILFRTTDGQQFSRLALNAAKLCATVVVTAWNFSASKFITFKS